MYKTFFSGLQYIWVTGLGRGVPGFGEAVCSAPRGRRVCYELVSQTALGMLVTASYLCILLVLCHQTCVLVRWHWSKGENLN